MAVLPEVEGLAMKQTARTNRRGRLGACIPLMALFALGPTSLRAVQAGGNDGVLRIDTQLVQVNVVVMDDDGPIPNLTAADFTIFDDGVERPIAMLDIIRIDDLESGFAGALPDDVVSNRLDRLGRQPESATAIIVDRLNTLYANQGFMNHQVETFVDQALGDGEHIAVFELSERGFTVLGDFTARPSDVRRALRTRRPVHSLAVETSVGTIAGNLSVPQDVSQDGSAYYRRRRVLLTAAALETAGRYLSRLPGRKNLVWLAEEFPLPHDLWRDPRVLRLGLPPSTLDRIQTMFRVVIDGNVAVYPIDALGLRSEEDGSAGRLLQQLDIPLTIAEATGGRASFNTNGLAARMRDAVRDATVSYSLGFYVPEVESDTRFHELEVRVAGRDVDVLHRKGYYGFRSPAPDPPALDQALLDPLDATALGLLARVEAVPEAPGRYRVAIGVDAADLNLVRDAGDWTGELEVAVAFFPDASEPLLVLPPARRPFRATEAELDDTRPLNGLVVEEVVDTGGGPGVLRLAVRDVATNATGSLWAPLGDD